MGPEMPKRRWKLQYFPLSGQLLEYFRLCSFQIISCHDWWPLTKPGYINMTQRQSNNQWTGVIAAHTKVLQKIPNTKIWWKSSLLDFCNQDGILQLIIFQRAKLSEPRITYLCWCNWRKFWRKNSNGISQLFLFCTTSLRLTGHLQAWRNWPTWTPNVLISHTHLRIWPVGLLPFPRTETTNEY